MESYIPHKVRSLGISNVKLEVLQLLYQNSSIQPLVVQNRFYAASGYDVVLRNFCEENDILYEAFWTLTGNPEILVSVPVRQVSDAVGVSRQVALYALVIDQGIVPLNGTTNVERMRQDLEHVEKVKKWALSNGAVWCEIVKGFEHSLEER